MTQVQVYDGAGLSPEVLLETVVNLFLEAYPDRFSEKDRPWLAESLDVHFIDLLGEQESLREMGLDLEASPFAGKPAISAAEIIAKQEQERIEQQNNIAVHGTIFKPPPEIESSKIASNGNKAEKFRPLHPLSSALRRQRARDAERKNQ